MHTRTSLQNLEELALRKLGDEEGRLEEEHDRGARLGKGEAHAVRAVSRDDDLVRPHRLYLRRAGTLAPGRRVAKRAGARHKRGLK